MESCTCQTPTCPQGWLPTGLTPHRAYPPPHTGLTPPLIWWWGARSVFTLTNRTCSLQTTLMVIGAAKNFLSVPPWPVARLASESCQSQKDFQTVSSQTAFWLTDTNGEVCGHVVCHVCCSAWSGISGDFTLAREGNCALWIVPDL